MSRHAPGKMYIGLPDMLGAFGGGCIHVGKKTTAELFSNCPGKNAVPPPVHIRGSRN